MDLTPEQFRQNIADLQRYWSTHPTEWRRIMGSELPIFITPEQREEYQRMTDTNPETANDPVEPTETTDPRDTDTLTHAVPLDEEQSGLPEVIEEAPEVPDDIDEDDPEVATPASEEAEHDDAPGADA